MMPVLGRCFRIDRVDRMARNSYHVFSRVKLQYARMVKGAGSIVDHVSVQYGTALYKVMIALNRTRK